MPIRRWKQNGLMILASVSTLHGTQWVRKTNFVSKSDQKLDFYVNFWLPVKVSQFPITSRKQYGILDLFQIVNRTSRPCSEVLQLQTYKVGKSFRRFTLFRQKISSLRKLSKNLFNKNFRP